jgi:hypothetical protein
MKQAVILPPKISSHVIPRRPDTKAAAEKSMNQLEIAPDCSVRPHAHHSSWQTKSVKS